MICRDDACPCMSHVEPATHIPACRYCRVPLVPADDLALCPQERCPNRGVAFVPEEWVWMERAHFNQSELPPWNGWEPVKIPEEMLA